MYKNDLFQWALDFYSSVKPNAEGSRLIADPNYNMEGAIAHLRSILEESGISRIPPECRLVHNHYRNPAVFKDLTPRFYHVVEKTIKSDHYVEYYVREENGIYHGGYVGRLANNPDAKIITVDRDLFSFEVDRYKYFTDHLNALGISDPAILASRERWYHQTKMIKELIDNL